MKKYLFAFLALCFALLAFKAQAVMLFDDEFDQDILNPGWQVNSVSGVDFLLTKQPGRLYVNNEGPNTTVVAGNAASLSLDAPAGDFIMETQITDSDGCCNTFGTALNIQFNNKNTLAWVLDNGGNGRMGLYDTKAGTETWGDQHGLPLYIRVRRISNNYIFEYKQHENDTWIGEKQVISNDIPIKIGLLFPKPGSNYYTSLGYFHLEAPAPDGPAPQLDALSATSAAPGTTLVLTGENFMPGYSVLLMDGTPLSAIFPSATQAIFQVPLPAAAGSHVIAVQTGKKVSNNLSLATTSDSATFASLALGASGLLGDMNGDGKISIQDVTLLLRKAVGITN